LREEDPLSQLVAARSSRGLVIAADRRVVVFEAESRRLFSVRKLFALGPETAVATSGAAVGVETSRWAAAQWSGRSSLPFLELAEWVRRYDEFNRRAEGWFLDHPDAYRLSYILLGGRAPDGSFLFRFEASEAPGEPYRALPSGRILTAPRRLGLEGRLQRLGGDAAVDELAGTVADGLRLIARREADAVAGPFDLALFDSEGMRLHTVE
jgi:hypothetical protein